MLTESDFAFGLTGFFANLKPAFVLIAETMWPLCIPYLPFFPGHLFHLHILQSARDQGQDI